MLVQQLSMQLQVRLLPKVQGVNFRSGTIFQGTKLGVVGHAENTSSGTVTGEVQGESQPVAQMKVLPSSVYVIVKRFMLSQASSFVVCRNGCSTRGHLAPRLIGARLLMRNRILRS